MADAARRFGRWLIGRPPSWEGLNFPLALRALLRVILVVARVVLVLVAVGLVVRAVGALFGA